MTLLLDRPLDDISDTPPASSPVSLSAALRYKWTIVLISLAVMAVALPAIWLTMIPRYRATATIKILPTVPIILDKIEENGRVEFYTDFVRTQVGLIVSPKVLQRVLDDPDVRATGWYKEESDLSPFSRLRGQGLGVRPRGRTFLLDIVMNATRAEDAATLANTVAEVYLKVHEEQSDTDRLNKESRRRQIQEDLKVKVDIRQNRINELLSPPNPPEPVRELNFVREQLGNLKNRLVDTQKDIQETEATLAYANESVVTTQPGATTQPAVPDPKARYPIDVQWTALDNQVELAELRVAQLERAFGQENPRLIRAKEDLEMARKRRTGREVILHHRDTNPPLGGGLDIRIGDPSFGELMNPVVAAREMLIKKRAAEKYLQDRISEMNDRRSQLLELVVQHDRYQQQLNSAQTRYNRITAKLEQSETESRALGNISLASLAVIPQVTSKDRRPIFSMVTVAASLLLGCAVAYLRVMLDPSVRNIGQVQALVPSPFLGVLPNVSAEAIADVDRGEMSEPIRILRTALLERLKGDSDRVLLVTSAGSGEGKTTMTIHLGNSLARLGQRVLLMDADFRKADLAGQLGIDGSVGLRQVLEGGIDASDAIQPTRMAGVDIMPAGTSNGDDDPRETLANGIFSARIEQLKQLYDTVIIDGPPVLAAADAQIVAGKVSGVLLTIRAEKCKRDRARAACEQLQMVGGRVIGVILNGVKEASDSYQYGYSYRDPSGAPQLTTNPIDDI